jgi:hypothetical protein
MRVPLIFISMVVLLGTLPACSSPPTKSVRTTTTTTTVDDSGNASAEAHSELRTNVPAIGTTHGPIMAPASPVEPYESRQVIDQSESTDMDGTTTRRKRVTNY